MAGRPRELALVMALSVTIAACGGTPTGTCTPDQAAARRAATDGQSAGADPAALASFYDAARAGDVDALRRHIDAGIDLNAAGADLVLDSRDGYTVVTGKATALLLAANGGHFAAVDALVCAGADLDALTQRGDSALHRAVERDATDIVRYLLAYGADTNPKMPEFSGFTGTALHTAAARGNEAIVRALLDAGADPDARAMGLTPLDMAADEDVADLLGTRASEPVKAERELERLTLHDAVIAGNEWQVRRLLERGADPNQRDPSDATPILYAASGGHTRLVEVLLEAGAEADIADDAGETPLVRAVVTDRPDIVDILLAHGADPAATDFRGRPALDIAKSARVRGALEAALPAPEPAPPAAEPRPSGWLAGQAPRLEDRDVPQAAPRPALADEDLARLAEFNAELGRLAKKGATEEETRQVMERLRALQEEIVRKAEQDAGTDPGTVAPPGP